MRVKPHSLVLDAPAGLQGYKLADYLRLADKVIIPVVPSVFDMAATEDFLGSIRQDMRGRRNAIGIVAMRVDPRTRAAAMLEEFLKHFNLPILSYIRHTQNYVNAAARGLRAVGAFAAMVEGLIRVAVSCSRAGTLG